MERTSTPKPSLSTQEIEVYRESAEVAILAINCVNAKIRKIRARQPPSESFAEFHASIQARVAWQEINALCEQQGSFLDRVNHCITIIAPVECGALCQLVRDKPPTELREIIYRYLSVGKVDVVKKQVSYLKGRKCTWPFTIPVSDHEPAHSPDLILEDCSKSHLTDVDFMGEEIRNELLSYWFKNSIFSVGLHYNMLDNLLNTFIYELGCYQRDLISKIEIAILDISRDCDAYKNILCPARRQLESLARMKPRCSLHINNFLWCISSEDPFDKLTFFKSVLEDHWPYISAMEKPKLVVHYFGSHMACKMEVSGGDSIEDWIEKGKKKIDTEDISRRYRIQDAM